jgi:hypothetical protein
MGCDGLAITANGRGEPRSKVIALVAGMFVGADSIDDMDLLRHGGMRRLFTGLIVRRVRQLNPKHAPAGQAGKRGELFAVYGPCPRIVDTGWSIRRRAAA